MFVKDRLSFVALSLSGVLLIIGMLLTPRASAADYGPWQYVMGHPGVKYRLRCENCNQQGPHMWWVQFENEQGGRVAFDFRVSPVMATVHFSDRVVIDPGKTQEGWNSVNDGGATPIVYTANWKSGPKAD
jgi:hypothetical protein